MANSYTSLFIHTIFSTHNREPVLTSVLRDRLWAYMPEFQIKNTHYDLPRASEPQIALILRWV